MRNELKRMAAFSLTLALCGCGTPADPRLLVNDNLRAACFDYGASDGEIADFIDTVESDRLNGFTLQEELESAYDFCTDDPTPDFCDTCTQAIIYQVYGF